MSTLFEGSFMGKPVKGEIGKRGGKMLVRIEMEVTEGDRKGRRAALEGKLDERSIKYTKMAMLAVGWQGKTSASFQADVDAFIASGKVIPFEVEIATYDPQDGSKVRQWSAVRRIGAGAQPLDAIEPDKVRDVDRWLSEAGDVGPANGAGAANPNDLPFATVDAVNEHAMPSMWSRLP